MSETTRSAPVRRRRRRRRINPGFIVLLLTVFLLTAALVGLMLWGIGLLIGGQDKPTEPVHTEQTQQTGQTQPTRPEETVPPDTSPKGIVEAFAVENGLTLADYPDKLIELLARNPETEEYVLNYPLEYGKPHDIDISGYADHEGVPLFIQWDKQWGYLDYVGNQAGLSACGPTCLSMIAYYYTRDPDMHPAYMMEFAEKNGYGKTGSGTMWSLFSQGGPQLGFAVEELPLVESRIVDALEEGKPVAVSVGPGVFTEIGHYILLVGYEDGKFRVNDPNSHANSEKLWALEEFSDSVRNLWAFDY